MNSKLTRKLAAALLWSSTLIYQPSTSLAQGTAFTYQGKLDSGGAPFSGSAEFKATLWDTSGGGTALATNNPVQVVVGVTNGLFVLPLNFGANFPGGGRWLELEVRTTIGAFNVLSPRQPLTPTPYAITASNLSGTLPAAQVSGVLSSANLGGTYGGAVTFNNAGNSFTGNGGGLTNLNASQLGSGTVSDARLAGNVARTNQVWLLGGNAGTTPGTHFLGTMDTNALEFKVNGQRALRMEYASNAFYGYSPNMVGGFPGNILSNGFAGAVIGGGGSSGLPNRVGNNFATVIGGIRNAASGFASTAMGTGTTASGYISTAMGGYTTASGDYSAAMCYSTTASGFASTAMGGHSTAIGYASTAMGYSTTAIGIYSTAMGYRAKALNSSSFVWADSQEADFASTANNQFNIRAAGGVRLSDNTPNLSFGQTGRQMIMLYDSGVNATFGIGVQSSVLYQRAGTGSGFAWYQGGSHADGSYDPGAGGVRLLSLDHTGLYVRDVIVLTSDRNVKSGFAAVDARDVLEKVAALPITRWFYTNNPAMSHLGPMAQDFYAAFNVGPDDKHITTVDADGVALAAIQGLNQKVEDQALELKLRQAEITELTARLEKLEQRMNRSGQ